jgi:uncharacterized protein with GYD domain
LIHQPTEPWRDHSKVINGPQKAGRSEGLRGLQKDKASGRKQAVTKLLESLEGKLEGMYFALGERDVILIIDVPDIVTGAALGMAVSASGLVRTKSTALLTVEETDQAIAKQVAYRAPGG